MMTFMDMTFCVNETCARHGNDCDRAFTEEVKAGAIKADMPVALADCAAMGCYVPKDAI